MQAEGDQFLHLLVSMSQHAVCHRSYAQAPHGHQVCINCRSVKIASLEVAVGDVVVIAAADDEADGDAEPPLGLLQAVWQTAKGQLQLCG